MLRLLTWASGLLGVNLAALAFGAGLVVSAAGVGPATFYVARWIGRGEGAAEADKTAELNTVRRDLEEARVDLAAAHAAAAIAQEQSAHNASAAAEALKTRDAYAQDLLRRGAPGACGFAPADLDVLRLNSWPKRPGGRPTGAPGRR